MKQVTLGIILMITTSTAMSGNDVWQTLFKEKLQEAKQGNSNAQFDIGSMYKNGRGVSPDRGKAIEWYSKAAAQDNQKAVSRLKLLEANEERFKKELITAANGNMESQYKIGNMYTEGIGTNVDLAKAAENYELSAHQGYAKAEYKLGLIYNEGTGVSPNKKTAYKWFKQAADKNYPAAQYYLGKMYASGKGVKRNYAVSLEWYTKAVDGGFNQARSEMIDVSSKMNSSKQNNTAPATNTAARKPSSAVKAKNNSSSNKKFGIEDLMVAAWSREGKPVAYLPSSINNCRTESDKISCYSDNQTRKTSNSTIKFKTKSIMRKFSNDGSFNVTYRNLVTDATKIATTIEDTGDADEIGGEDVGTTAYTVKTGWGKEHLLECQMKDSGTVSCQKDKTHSFLLISPQTVASGN
jgi:TPR repeat protein